MFASWMQNQLLRRQWNEADLTRRLQVSSGTVSRWMSGERRPSSLSCDLIADAFGVEPDLVLTLVGHRPATEALEPDDERSHLISLLKRVKLTPDRQIGLERTLEGWLERDRRSCSGARG
jgi:transcriptional regulator with XRE-family HTH domain